MTAHSSNAQDMHEGELHIQYICEQLFAAMGPSRQRNCAPGVPPQVNQVAIVGVSIIETVLIWFTARQRSR